MHTNHLSRTGSRNIISENTFFTDMRQSNLLPDTGFSVILLKAETVGRDAKVCLSLVRSSLQQAFVCCIPLSGIGII
ncbi:hypothetical protein Cst_c05950 [Thermoclostridium stercorarium subsp. stercorarium DSM 8532]|uniref:Uncharacterized protein n=1 Tax=Thermoclostridium stercorarium (strain ATCC 35414 / DSM 8532 / NCIMB 11754) TaxID=1121335 RepID=L7VLQ4_THES1|nr:hypothetical protein Cst_c05950 [Thermoclostridium stercorarium subsp. stercorarium DSM 8532]